MCWIMMSDNIIIELCELSRNMNWLNGVDPEEGFLVLVIVS